MIKGYLDWCLTFTAEVKDNTIHYQTIKELWESIESLYSRKDNLHKIYDLTPLYPYFSQM